MHAFPLVEITSACFRCLQLTGMSIGRCYCVLKCKVRKESKTLFLFTLCDKSSHPLVFMEKYCLVLACVLSEGYTAKIKNMETKGSPSYHPMQNSHCGFLFTDWLIEFSHQNSFNPIQRLSSNENHCEVPLVTASCNYQISRGRTLGKHEKCYGAVVQSLFAAITVKQSRLDPKYNLVTRPS